MKKLLLSIIFSLFPMWAAHASSDANHLLAEAVEQAREQRVPDNYAFSRRVFVDAEDEQVDRLERYDPSLPKAERWTLLAVDGNVPSAADIRDYDPDKNADFDINGADVPGELYAEVVGEIDPLDAKLIEETAEFAIFSIDKSVARFLDDKQAEFKDGIIGRLRLEKGEGKPYVSEIRIYAPEPIRAFIGTGFDRFELAFRFERHPEGGHVLPGRILFDMDLQALLFISVEVLTRIDFEDWIYQGDSEI